MLSIPILISDNRTRGVLETPLVFISNPAERIRPKSRHIITESPSSSPSLITSYLSLAAGAPDALEVAVTLGEAIQGVVTLTTSTDEAAQSICLVLTGVPAVLVNLSDRDLDGRVVVGLDDTVGGAALAGDVEINDLSLFVLHFGGFVKT
jgi:hypothetical protein